MTLLPFHIIGGVLGIVAGFVAIAATKGASLHRRSGMVFVYAMLALSATGVVMAMLKGNRGNVMGGGLTLYLVMTALLTMRPRVMRNDLAATLIGAAFGLAGLLFGFEALGTANGRLDGYPPPMYFVFSTITLLAVLGDIRMMLAGGLQGAPRLVRHLWRMCFALFLAAASFFLVPRRMPELLRHSPVVWIPTLVPILAILYWRWRLRRKRPVHSAIRVSVPEAM